MFYGWMDVLSGMVEVFFLHDVEVFYDGIEVFRDGVVVVRMGW